MPTYRPNSPSFGPQGPRVAGPGTRVLCGLMVGITLIASLADRQGLGATELLVFHRDRLAHGELWRLLTYPWLAASPFGLVVSTVVLYLFGSSQEQLWGTRRFVRFVGLTIVGAGVLAVPLGYLLSALLPFVDQPVALGPDAIIDAMLMTMALDAPRSRILFGFVLPLEARTFVWLMVGLDVVNGIMAQVSHLSLTLSGLAMGFVLHTQWRPPFMRRTRRVKTTPWAASHLHVVPPNKGRHTIN